MYYIFNFKTIKAAMVDNEGEYYYYCWVIVEKINFSFVLDFFFLLSVYPINWNFTIVSMHIFGANNEIFSWDEQ